MGARQKPKIWTKILDFITLLTHKTNFLIKMKKNYLSPAIEATEVMVEAGIALSDGDVSVFGLGEEAGYTEETFAW